MTVKDLTPYQITHLWQQAQDQGLTGIHPAIWLYDAITARYKAAGDHSKIICGVGIYEDGRHKKYDGNGGYSWHYDLWAGMLWRCYRKHSHDDKKTYIGCTVDHRFHHYQEFMNWAEHQIGFGVDGYHLDKDIILKGNKIYGPETCAFVPRAINNLLTNRKNHRGEWPIGVTQKKSNGRFIAACTKHGKQSSLGNYSTPELAVYAYKERKESIIKDTANQYRNSIDSRVYESLMSHEVLITD